MTILTLKYSRRIAHLRRWVRAETDIIRRIEATRRCAQNAEDEAHAEQLSQAAHARWAEVKERLREIRELENGYCRPRTDIWAEHGLL